MGTKKRDRTKPRNPAQTHEKKIYKNMENSVRNKRMEIQPGIQSVQINHSPNRQNATPPRSEHLLCEKRKVIEKVIVL